MNYYKDNNICTNIRGNMEPKYDIFISYRRKDRFNRTTSTAYAIRKISLKNLMIPLKRNIILSYTGGKDFIINAPNKTEDRIYVKKVKLNGEPLKDLKLTHQQIMAGGILDFQMK